MVHRNVYNFLLRLKYVIQVQHYCRHLKVDKGIGDSVINKGIQTSDYHTKKQGIQEQKKMGCAVLFYVMVLVVDVSVGSTLIVWKCAVRHLDDECKLAVGGTVGSVLIWLLIMLICPCFVTRFECCMTYDNTVKKISKYMTKLRHRKPHEIYVQNEIYRPTTTTLLDLGGKGSCAVTSDIIGPQHSDVNSKLLTSSNGLPHVPQERIYVFNENKCSNHQGALIKYLDHDDP